MTLIDVYDVQAEMCLRRLSWKSGYRMCSNLQMGNSLNCSEYVAEYVAGFFFTIRFLRLVNTLVSEASA
jgi:hypothetical protein